MRNKSVNSELLNEFQLYLQAITSQDALLQSYRILFLTLEAILFALAFALLSIGLERFLWFPVLFGILFSILWIIICNHRGWIIDQIKKEAENLVNNTRLERLFKKAYRMPGEKTVPRFTFNILLPLIAVVLWLGIFLFAA